MKSVPINNYVERPNISDNNLIYTGIPQQPYIDNGEEYTVIVDNQVNVGEYTVQFKMLDNSYYTLLTNAKKSIINKSKLNNWIKQNSKGRNINTKRILVLEKVKLIVEIKKKEKFDFRVINSIFNYIKKY